MLRRRILLWYSQNKRDFPWRHTKDPYKIMIAEFMLHRTRAEQVVPVYQDFIKKYPDVDSLADADPVEVSNVTENLGLHWRGRHFVNSALFIRNNFRSRMPDSRDKLLSVPGIGEYVAGAILTVVFNKKEWVVDSNIARFLNRFYNLKLSGEIRRKREIIEMSRRFYQTTRAGQLTFALLDFTAMVCKPVKPACYFCTIKRKCIYWKSHERSERRKEWNS